MKRGRPSEPYLSEEFVAVILHRMAASSITQTALGKNSGVNRGTLSGILNGERKASVTNRIALMRALGFEEAIAVQFGITLSKTHSARTEAELISDYNFPRAELLKGVTLLAQGFYRDAARTLKSVFFEACVHGDLILQADAAARLTWLCLEIGNFKSARRWLTQSLTTCRLLAHHSVNEMVDAAGPLKELSPQSASFYRVLSDALHLRSQILATQILYLKSEQLQIAAQDALAVNLALDQGLGLHQPIGNALRWRAIVTASSLIPKWSEAIRLIDQGREHLPQNGLYGAHLESARGIVLLQSGKPARARRHLVEAGAQLSGFNDARGFALNLYHQSETVLMTSNHRRNALRLILAAAALHPHFPVIERARQQAAYANARDLNTEVDRLLAGYEENGAVHKMLSRLVRNSSHSSDDLLRRNLKVLFDSSPSFLAQSARLQPIQTIARPV